MRFELDRDFRTLPELLMYRAELHPNREAALFLHDDGTETRFTYGELWRRTVAVARKIVRRCALFVRTAVHAFTRLAWGRYNHRV